MESVPALRGVLRRGTSSVGVRISFIAFFPFDVVSVVSRLTFYGFQVPIDVQYRPWAGMTDLPEALRLSVYRTILVGTGRFVWYLGERVVRQHSGDRFVVPSSPPESMLDSRLIRGLINRGERYTFPWQELVHMENDYARDLLPSLAPPPRLPEV